MEKQEFMVVDDNTGFKTFFFEHSLMTAKTHAGRYVDRNRGKFPMSVYRLNTKPVGNKWILISKINELEGA